MRKLIPFLPILALALWSVPANAIPVAAVAAVIEGTTIAAATITATAIAVTVALNIGLSDMPVQPRADRQLVVPPRTRFWPLRVTLLPFLVGRAAGTCMNPLVYAGQWMVADRRASIRGGDLAIVKLDPATVDAALLRRTGGGLWFAKRFLWAKDGNLTFEATNPRTMFTGADEQFAVLLRVRALRPTFLSAWRAAIVMLLRPERYQEQLAG